MIDIDRHVLTFDGDNFVTVAVSGGVDSIVGLHLLHRLYGEKIKACHFNHNLRPLNNVMQKSVEWFCEDHGIALISSKRAGKHGQILSESMLRDLRVEFYESVGGTIATCHHLDDAVESYAMNFLRGCPEHKPLTSFSVFDKCILVKPFLCNPKSKIMAYAENNFLNEYVVEDDTNADSGYCRRNWIRNTLLPQFEEIGLRKVVLKKFYL